MLANFCIFLMETLAYISDSLWAEYGKPDGRETVDYCATHKIMDWEPRFEEPLCELFAKIRNFALMRALQVPAIAIMWGIADMFQGSSIPFELATLYAKCEEASRPLKRPRLQERPATLVHEWVVFGMLKDYPLPIANLCITPIIRWRGNVNTHARMAISSLGQRDLSKALAKEFLVTDQEIAQDAEVLDLSPWERPSTHWAYGKTNDRAQSGE